MNTKEQSTNHRDMDAGFTTLMKKLDNLDEKLDANQAENRVMFEELRHEITRAKLWVVAMIPASTGFFILLLKFFSE